MCVHTTGRKMLKLPQPSEVSKLGKNGARFKVIFSKRDFSPCEIILAPFCSVLWYWFDKFHHPMSEIMPSRRSVQQFQNRSFCWNAPWPVAAIFPNTSLRAGMGNLFAITGRINCGLWLAGRRKHLILSWNSTFI